MVIGCQPRPPDGGQAAIFETLEEKFLNMLQLMLKLYYQNREGLILWQGLNLNHIENVIMAWRLFEVSWAIIQALSCHPPSLETSPRID